MQWSVQYLKKRSFVRSGKHLLHVFFIRFRPNPAVFSAIRWQLHLVFCNSLEVLQTKGQVGSVNWIVGDDSTEAWWGLVVSEQLMQLHLFFCLLHIQHQLETNSSCSCLERKGLNRSQAYCQQTRQVLLVSDRPIPSVSSLTSWQSWNLHSTSWNQNKFALFLASASDETQLDCGRWQHGSLMRSRSFRTVDAASSHFLSFALSRPTEN